MITGRQWIRAGITALALAAAAGRAQAQITTFVGFDLGAAVPGANAIAQRNAFVAATGGSVQIDFESPTLPAGVSLSGGARDNTPNCAPPLCGGNTTSGGSFFYEFTGAPSGTITFASPISFFGAFFGGLQLAANSLTFTDGAGAQTVAIPGDGAAGGFAFVGFTSASGGISSITMNWVQASTLDIVSMDDVIYGTQVVPEPGTWALLATGLAGLAGVARRRRRHD